MDRTVSKKLFNEFTTEADLKSPGGLLRSADMDRYIEKALQPLIEEGKAFKQISVNRRTGIRSTRYSYQGGKAVQNSMAALLNEMPASLGYELDAAGNVEGTEQPPPVRVAKIEKVVKGQKIKALQDQHYYNETRERILDPRTAASIRAGAARDGGVSTTDKASGYTTTLLRAGPSGKTREMRKLVDDTDKKYLAGELPSSALAGGASPATLEERARAQVARQAKYEHTKQAAIQAEIDRDPAGPFAIEMRAKQQRINNREDRARLLEAERTPGTKEFDRRIFRNIRAGEARADAAERFIKENPNSWTALAARKEKWSRRGQKAKSAVGGAARFARNALFTVVGTILSAVTAGVGVLMKSYAVITQIGSDIRKREINEAKFNFDPGTVRNFELFAKQNGMDKDLLIRAAGGVHSAWSTPLNYADSGFNQLAPYLREGTVKLVSMATGSGDENVFKILTSVIDDLVSKSEQGIAGAKTFEDHVPQERRHLAFSGNVSALSAHNEAWGELMSRYWHDYLASGASSIAAWKKEDRDGKMRTMTVENWMTQGGWSKEYVTDTGLRSPVVQEAAEETFDLVNQFTGAYGNLAADIAAALSGSLGDIVEWLRSIVDNWLAPFFPAFAMKENQRAVYLNQRSESLAQSVLPGYEAEAESALLDIMYDGTLSEFKPVLDALRKGDTSKIPHNVDLKGLNDSMSVFTRYYHTADILDRIKEERDKAGKDKNYVQRHIVGTAASMAAVSGEDAMILQHQLAQGVNNIRIRAPDEDTQYTFTDYLQQLAVGMGNVPNAVGKVISTAAKTFTPMTAALENRIQAEQEIIGSSRRSKAGEMLYNSGLPFIGKKSSYDKIESSLRELITKYDEQGYPDMALDTLKRLHQFYLKYPQDLVKVDPVRQAAINKQIEKDTDWMWSGDNFAKATRSLHPAQLADLTYRRIASIEAQEAYAKEHTGLNSRGTAQRRTTNEITAAGMFNKINERIIDEVDRTKLPELSSVHGWLDANPANRVYLDAFDELNNRANSDIIINFMAGDKIVQTLRIPNKYNLRNDINLNTAASAGIRNVTDALEAAGATQ